MLLILSGTSLPVAGVAVARPSNQKQERNRQVQQPKTKADGGSLTGCVDEQEGGRYVLIDEKSLVPIANLEAEGFPNEGFAKHLGEKVTVRGTINSSGARPVVKVRSIEKLSNSCGGKQEL